MIHEPNPRRAPEFGRVGLAPGRWEAWHPLGVWLATHILFAGFPAKLWREEAVRHLGADAVGLFATDGPATSGSNGWLVDGSRTTTGQAVIAGDPHRFIEEPGVYQQIHLSCPEFDVVGLAVLEERLGLAPAEVAPGLERHDDVRARGLPRLFVGGRERLGGDGPALGAVPDRAVPARPQHVADPLLDGVGRLLLPRHLHHLPPPPRPGRGPIPLIVALLIVLIMAVLAVPQLPEGTPRIAGYVAAVAIAAVAVWKLKPTPGRKGR